MSKRMARGPPLYCHRGYTLAEMEALPESMLSEDCGGMRVTPAACGHTYGGRNRPVPPSQPTGSAQPAQTGWGSSEGGGSSWGSSTTTTGNTASDWGCETETGKGSSTWGSSDGSSCVGSKAARANERGDGWGSKAPTARRVRPVPPTPGQFPWLPPGFGWGAPKVPAPLKTEPLHFDSFSEAGVQSHLNPFGNVKKEFMIKKEGPFGNVKKEVMIKKERPFNLNKPNKRGTTAERFNAREAEAPAANAEPAARETMEPR